MTDIDIAPEVLRAVADWMDTHGNVKVFYGTDLRNEADRREREQADEKRIDALAQIYADAFAIESDVATWDHAQDFLKNAYRSGIRAVLAKLDESAQVENVRPIGWYRTMTVDFASRHFGFPPFGGGKFTAPDGGKWAWDDSCDHWELREYPDGKGGES